MNTIRYTISHTNKAPLHNLLLSLLQIIVVVKMPLSIEVAESNYSDENESPLGKRKSDVPSESCRSGKRSPLSDVRSQIDAGSKPLEVSPSKKSIGTPLKPCVAKKTSTPYSSSKFVPRVSREEVEANDEGRASVNKLSAWLASESAKKAKKPPTIVPAPNPVRFRMKPKINKEDVEATDDKRVSVKTLSAWISDDPFEQKKLKHIRSGIRVINKSRVFESDKKKIDVQVESGSVHEKQAWLSSAFKHENQEARPPVNKEKPQTLRAYQNKPKPQSPDKCLMSVNEKKEWLNNAFKKNDNCILPVKSFDSTNGEPHIKMCASADDATGHLEFSSIGQRASYDGVSSAQQNSNSPVRLYKKTDVEVESSKIGLKTVHDKQEWLANAFKAQTVQKESPSCFAQKVSEEAVPEPVISPCLSEEFDAQETFNEEEQTDQNVVSVADRAKWLRGAFSK